MTKGDVFLPKQNDVIYVTQFSRTPDSYIVANPHPINKKVWVALSKDKDIAITVDPAFWNHLLGLKLAAVTRKLQKDGKTCWHLSVIDMFSASNTYTLMEKRVATSLEPRKASKYHADKLTSVDVYYNLKCHEFIEHLKDYGSSIDHKMLNVHLGTLIVDAEDECPIASIGELSKSGYGNISRQITPEQYWFEGNILCVKNDFMRSRATTLSANIIFARPNCDAVMEMHGINTPPTRPVWGTLVVESEYFTYKPNWKWVYY